MHTSHPVPPAPTPPAHSPAPPSLPPPGASPPVSSPAGAAPLDGSGSDAPRRVATTAASADIPSSRQLITLPAPMRSFSTRPSNYVVIVAQIVESAEHQDGDA